MSEYSSVRTSRVQSIAAKSVLSSAIHSSRMSRISSKASSVPTSKITGVSQATSHLTELLQSKLLIDEYGFTDKACKTCSNHLSIEEIVALTIPLDSNGTPLCNIDDINFEEVNLICLSCYAE
jgi:hypothetical protein